MKGFVDLLIDRRSVNGKQRPLEISPRSLVDLSSLMTFHAGRLTLWRSACLGSAESLIVLGLRSSLTETTQEKHDAWTTVDSPAVKL